MLSRATPISRHAAKPYPLWGSRTRYDAALMNAWILLGGRLTANQALERTKERYPAGFVVAADGGIKHATLLGVRPDLWVGDFDSSSATDFPGLKMEIHPREKDQLDAELAIERAIERGAKTLILWGALGGRFDHTLALALIALKLSRQGLEVVLHSGDESALPVLSGQDYPLETFPGETLSVLALERMEGLTLGGVRWPLNGATLEVGSGWGMSNVALGRQVNLSFAGGVGLVVIQHGAV